MDEVFGNSSSETVVSVDLEKNVKASSSNICLKASETVAKSSSSSPPNNKINANDSKIEPKVYFLPNELEASRWRKIVPSTNIKGLHCNRPSVITCAAALLKGPEKKYYGSHPPIHSPKGEPVFKVPLPPPGSTPIALRHAHSAVVSRLHVEPSRPRSHSTTVSSQNPKFHPYQNIPIHSTSHRELQSPPYINLPKRDRGKIKTVQTPPTSPWRTSAISSAPSTPRGTHDKSPHVGHSYIQLWTGIREGQKSSTDSISDKSAAGYVEMSSPYIRSPNSSILSDLASHLAAYAGKAPKSIFCPFCPRHFTHESNLGNHIRTAHSIELQNTSNETNEVKVQYCPVCHSRFFNLDILPNHLLEYHRSSVVELLSKHDCLSPNEVGLKCPFCVKRVPKCRVGEDVMLYHVLQFHANEYCGLINSVFKPTFEKAKTSLSRKLSSESLADCLAFVPDMTSTPGLSIRFNTLSCETISESSCFKMDETWNSHCHPKSSPYDKISSHTEKPNLEDDAQLNKGILRSQTDLSRKPSVKRELRFSVPPVTSEEIFVPLSPEQSPEQPSNVDNRLEKLEKFVQQRQNMPMRVDSLSSADFIEMTHLPTSKKRKLGLGLKSKKAFKKKDKENFDGVRSEKCKSISKLGSSNRIITTSTTRVFRKPMAVEPPRVPANASLAKKHLARFRSKQDIESSEGGSSQSLESEEPSPFSNMKLYSPLRIFRCNNCRIKFCDNDSLSGHISLRHRGLLGFLRPQFGCGICSAKFFENKYLVKHCLQHHTSLLEIRSPSRHKISIFKTSQKS